MDELLVIFCPACAGGGAYLGTLGILDWFRCIDCGIEFSQDSNFEPEVL